MLRIVLTQLFLFLLPFACYATWLWLSKKGENPDSWSKGPVAWLSLAGLALAIVGFVTLAMLDKSPEGKEYRPSEFRDGVLVPGRFE